MSDQNEEGSTRPIPPPRRRRRRIPADDIPPRVYSRPGTPGNPSDTLPPRSTSARVPVTPPVTPPEYYPPQEMRPARSRRTPAAPREKRESGLYLPWWSLLIMLVFVGCAAIGALMVASSIDRDVTVGEQTPLVVVITSTYTVGPPPTQIPVQQAATLTPTKPLPTIPPSVTLPPGDFSIGQTVQVVGVGISGLNVRSGPGVDQAVKFRASDGEKYILKDGPQTASGDEWWYIQAPDDPTKVGWASRRFLQAAAP